MEGTGKLLRVGEAPRKKEDRLNPELIIRGRILWDAGIRPGDSVAVEVVADGELRVRRVAKGSDSPK